MNVLLVQAHEIDSHGQIRIQGRRAEHLAHVLKVEVGRVIRAGIIDGQLGKAVVREAGSHELLLEFSAEAPPPLPVDCILVLALPRPKMMRRVLQNVATMGIKEIHLIHSRRVEKSYWQTPWLEEKELTRQLILGLEQAVDTQMPKVDLHRFFRPFAEDVLPKLAAHRMAMVAHPYASEKCPVDMAQPSLMAIGPEGGFTDDEVVMLIRSGLKPVSIGPRILRVETAIPAMISRLYPG